MRERTRRIEVTLENDISDKFKSLFDGYQLHQDMLEELRVLEQETNTMVSALDIAKFVHNQRDDRDNLKIVK